MTLVAHWRLWWRRWSTWASGFNAALWTAITAKSGMLLGFLPFLSYVPAQWRGFAAGALATLTFAATFVVPIIITNMRQPKLAEKCAETRNA